MPYIKILQGIGAGKMVPLDQEILFGRGADNHICLPDPRVSRHHAHIIEHQARLVIEDLQSSNGTLLRNSRLFPGTFYDLSHGDRIKIGSTLMVFIDGPLEGEWAETE
jgi:SARP family transcriptional regulator, regulator of embCAB operon